MLKKGVKNKEDKATQLQICKYISEELVKGRPRPDIRKEIMTKYQLSQATANRYVKYTYKKNLELDEKELAGLRFLQLNRLEKVYNEAMSRGDLKSAVNAADVINKLFNLYENKYKVEVTKDVIKFQFDEFVPQPVENVVYEEIVEDNNEIGLVMDGEN